MTLRLGTPFNKSKEAVPKYIIFKTNSNVAEYMFQTNYVAKSTLICICVGKATHYKYVWHYPDNLL